MSVLCLAIGSSRTGCPGRVPAGATGGPRGRRLAPFDPTPGWIRLGRRALDPFDPTRPTSPRQPVDPIDPSRGGSHSPSRDKRRRATLADLRPRVGVHLTGALDRAPLSPESAPTAGQRASMVW
jgi:hypothetical protein